MDAFSDPLNRRVVFVKSAQVGATEIFNNVVGYHIDQAPCAMLMVQPTQEMGDAWSKDRLAPMLQDTPALRGKVRSPRSKDSGNTLRHKVFPGGHLTVLGANSGASLASRPAKKALADEVDRYPASIAGEGDPVDLVAKRLTTYWDKTIGLASTPTLLGASRIWSAWEESDMRRFFVPCPKCGTFQHLIFKQVKWDTDRPETAVYRCEACSEPWDDADRREAVAHGYWEATAEFNGTAGFHINEIYSPWVSLEDMVRNFLEAKKLPETLQVWINTALGLPWEERGETVSEHGLFNRREQYDHTAVPKGVALITAGVDVQDNRLEVEFVGWGRDKESWGVDKVILHGDPSSPGLWAKLDKQLLRPFKREDGLALKVSATCLDTGGHFTQTAYDFCHPRLRRKVWPIRGDNTGKKPIWPPRRTRRHTGSGTVFTIGVHDAKMHIYRYLKIKKPGPGFCHFPEVKDYSEEHFKQLTAEKLVIRRPKNGGYPEFRFLLKSDGRRNEALDLRVYALAALHSLHEDKLFDLNRLADRMDRKALEVRAGGPAKPSRSLDALLSGGGSEDGSEYDDPYLSGG